MSLSLFNEHENLLPYKGEVYLYQAFFTPQESKAYLHDLINSVAWKQEPIKIFGKEIMQPRLTAWYGDKPYTYSGITMEPLAWTQVLSAIKEKTETVAGVRFTSALLNFYRDGKDSMGWHRDNEKELGVNPVIASVSFGQSRTFKLRDYYKKSNSISVELGNGSLLLMQGETQHYWEHCITKTAKQVGERINITFRVIQ